MRYPAQPVMHIALFGTSADPPTAGHQAILNWLSHRFDEVAVWASDNPFKSHQTALEHRMAMLQLLIKDIYPPRQNIHLYPQLSHPRAIYTVETAQRIWKSAGFTFVIGADLVPQLLKWHRIDELLRQVNWLVIPRPGYHLNEPVLAELRRQGATVTIADLTGPDTSSTAYREHRDTDTLTPPIEAYIQREQLYACPDDSREKQPIR